MARVWNSEAFRATLRREYPSLSDPDVAARMGLEAWELDALVGPTPPAWSTLAPHPSEVRLLERLLNCDAAVEGWVVADDELANHAIEESHPVLEARPTGALRSRFEAGKPEAMQEFLAQFADLAMVAEIFGVGQQLRFTRNGIEFLALDSYGTHRYVDGGRMRGIEVRKLPRWRSRSIPRRPRWLRADRTMPAR